MFEVMARLKVRDGELAGFKEQAAEMMRQTREKDTRTAPLRLVPERRRNRVRGPRGLTSTPTLCSSTRRNIAEARDTLFHISPTTTR